jgi:hypothetical protein
MSGLFRAAALLAIMLMAPGAASLAQTVPAPPVQARPAQPTPQTPIPAAQLPPDLPADPALPQDVDPAPRVGGYAGDQALGGADCRTGCDKAYYLCLSNDDSGQCSTSWTQCLTACPSHSSNF